MNPFKSQVGNGALSVLAALALSLAYWATPVRAEGTGCYLCAYTLVFCPGGGCPNYSCLELDREEHPGVEGYTGCLGPGSGNCDWDEDWVYCQVPDLE
jgi:hypothetical protein